MSVSNIDKNVKALPTKDFNVYNLSVENDLTVKGDFTSYCYMEVLPPLPLALTGTPTKITVFGNEIENGVLSRQTNDIQIAANSPGSYKIDINVAGVFPGGKIELRTRLDGSDKNLNSSYFVSSEENQILSSFILSVSDIASPQLIDFTLASSVNNIITLSSVNVSVVKL